MFGVFFNHFCGLLEQQAAAVAPSPQRREACGGSTTANSVSQRTCVQKLQSAATLAPARAQGGGGRKHHLAKGRQCVDPASLWLAAVLTHMYSVTGALLTVCAVAGRLASLP